MSSHVKQDKTLQEEGVHWADEGDAPLGRESENYPQWYSQPPFHYPELPQHQLKPLLLVSVCVFHSVCGDSVKNVTVKEFLFSFFFGSDKHLESAEAQPSTSQTQNTTKQTKQETKGGDR